MIMLSHCIVIASTYMCEFYKKSVKTALQEFLYVNWLVDVWIDTDECTKTMYINIALEK